MCCSRFFPILPPTIQLAHHGSATDGSKEFIDRVKPRVAFGSSYWAEKGHHHPRCDVITALEEYADTTKEHKLDCWGDGGLKTKTLKRPIWSTMPAEDGYIIALMFGSKVSREFIPRNLQAFTGSNFKDSTGKRQREGATDSMTPRKKKKYEEDQTPLPPSRKKDGQE